MEPTGAMDRLIATYADCSFSKRERWVAALVLVLALVLQCTLILPSMLAMSLIVILALVSWTTGHCLSRLQRATRRDFVWKTRARTLPRIRRKSEARPPTVLMAVER